MAIGDLPRTENDGGNSWKQLRSSYGLARDDDYSRDVIRNKAIRHHIRIKDARMFGLITFEW